MTRTDNYSSEAGRRHMRRWRVWKQKQKPLPSHIAAEALTLERDRGRRTHCFSQLIRQQCPTTSGAKTGSGWGRICRTPQPALGLRQ